MCKRDRMPLRLPPDPIIDLVVNLSIWGFILADRVDRKEIIIHVIAVENDTDDRSDYT